MTRFVKTLVINFDKLTRKIISCILPQSRLQHRQREAEWNMIRAKYIPFLRKQKWKLLSLYYLVVTNLDKHFLNRVGVKNVLKIEHCCILELTYFSTMETLMIMLLALLFAYFLILKGLPWIASKYASYRFGAEVGVKTIDFISRSLRDVFFRTSFTIYQRNGNNRVTVALGKSWKYIMPNNFSMV